jgi:hypothetical protein
VEPVREALIHGFAKVLGARLEPSELSAEERAWARVHQAD